MAAASAGLAAEAQGVRRIVTRSSGREHFLGDGFLVTPAPILLVFAGTAMFAAIAALAGCSDRHITPRQELGSRCSSPRPATRFA